MEPLCKTCCNGACPLQVTKDRSVLSCIEYIPGIMVGEIADRSNKHSKKEVELASEVNSLKMQVQFIKGQASDIREAYVKVAKEALTLARECKKENEELKSMIKAMVEERDRGNYGLEKHMIKEARPDYSDKEIEAYIKGYEEKELEIYDEITKLIKEVEK